MAIAQRQGHDPSTPQEQEEDPSFSFGDALYCLEARFEEDDEDDEVDGIQTTADKSSSLFPSRPVDGQQDSSWEDEEEEEEAELVWLLSKERGRRPDHGKDGWALAARREAVEWMLRVRGIYGFSALTAVLAVDYLDRFLSGSRLQQDNKPWMTQLVAVTCLSLSAKVEETHVPLLLDLQVGDARYMFEAKTVQRMELLVLSTLGWEMHPVTPLSFVHHVARRLGTSGGARWESAHWEFLRRCERLLVAAIYDSRSLRYLPSVLAAATMMHVIEEVEPFRSSEYKAHLLSALRMSQEMVEECCRFILGISETKTYAMNSYINSSSKRQRCCDHRSPRSPSGVIDASFSCDDDSNDSWAIDPPFDPVDDGLNPPPKKSRSSPSSVQDKVLDLPFMNRRLFEGIVNGSPI